MRYGYALCGGICRNKRRRCRSPSCGACGSCVCTCRLGGEVTEHARGRETGEGFRAKHVAREPVGERVRRDTPGTSLTGPHAMTTLAARRARDPRHPDRDTSGAGRRLASGTPSADGHIDLRIHRGIVRRTHAIRHARSAPTTTRAHTHAARPPAVRGVPLVARPYEQTNDAHDAHDARDARETRTPTPSLRNRVWHHFATQGPTPAPPRFSA